MGGDIPGKYFMTKIFATIIIGGLLTVYGAGVSETGEWNLRRQYKHPRLESKLLGKEKGNRRFGGLADLDNNGLDIPEKIEAYRRMGINLNQHYDFPIPTIEQLQKGIASYENQ